MSLQPLYYTQASAKINRMLGWIVLSWITVIGLRFIPLAGQWDPVAFSTYGLLIFSSGLYVAGWLVGSSFYVSQKTIEFETSNRAKILICSLISLLGAWSLGYEFAINRGYGFTTAVSDIRILEVDAVRSGRDVSVLGALGRLMMPSLFMAWILYRRNTSNTWLTTLAIASATIFTIYVQALFEGGRFFLVALFLVVMFSNLRIGKAKFSFKQIIVLFSGGLIFLFSALVFVDRASSQGRGLESAFLQFGLGFPITLSEGQAGNQASILEQVYFIQGMFWIYITSAVNDLDLLLIQGMDKHAWGAYQFPQFWGAISLLTGFQNSFSVFSLSRTGVYITSYGGWFIDFGHTGALCVTGFLGLVTGRSIALFYNGHTSRLAFFCPILLVIAFFMPIHSIITTVWPALIYVVLFGYSVKPIKRIAAQHPRHHLDYAQKRPSHLR